MIFRALHHVTDLVTLHGARFVNGIGIPSLGHAVGLRENGGGRGIAAAPIARSALRHTVQSLAMAHRFDAQPRHARSRTQERDLFLQDHQRNNVVHALFNRQVRILKRVRVLGVDESSSKDQKQGKRRNRETTTTLAAPDFLTAG